MFVVPIFTAISKTLGGVHRYVCALKIGSADANFHLFVLSNLFSHFSYIPHASIYSLASI